MNNELYLNILSQIISTILVYAALKTNDVTWKTWVMICASIFIAFIINIPSNIILMSLSSMYEMNRIVSIIASLILLLLIGWPVFALLRSEGKFFGADKGLACSLAYTIYSMFYGIISRYILS